MDSLHRLAVLDSLVVGSAVAALLFIAGTRMNPIGIKWVLFFPFYAVLYIFSIVWQITGVSLLFPVLALIGAAFSAVYLVVLLEKIPGNTKYAGVGIFFFIFLLVCGRAVFVRLIYLPQSANLGTALHSIKVFLEFMVGLAVLYQVLGDVRIPWQEMKEKVKGNLFKSD